MELNPDKVRKITSEVLTSLESLEELKRLPKSAFLSDPHKIASSKYNFIVAIEGIVDLCNHIIAKNAFRTPEDYADTFKVLAERNAFDQEFTNTLIQMVRFRTASCISTGKSTTTNFIISSWPASMISGVF